MMLARSLLVGAAAATALVFLTSSQPPSFFVLAEEEEEDGDFVIEEATPAPPKPFNPLVDLTEETFDTYVNSNPYVLVEFFATWCGVCKMVGPEVQQAAWLVHNLSIPGVSVARVDVDKQEDLAAKYGVTTYPTFFLFSNGQGEKFPMLLTGEAYVAGLVNMLGLEEEYSIVPARVFGSTSSSAELASWLFWRGSNEGKIANTLVLYLPPVAALAAAGDAAMSDARFKTASFDAASRELLRNPNFRFSIVNASASIFDDFEIPTSKATIVMYKDHDDGRVEYNGNPADASAIAAWMQAQSVPLVTVVTHRNLQRYRKNVLHLALYFVTEEQADNKPIMTYLNDKLYQVAAKLEAEGVITRGNFTIGIANGDKYVSWMHHYGIPAGSIPGFVMEYTPSESLYRMDIEEARQGSCEFAPMQEWISGLINAGATEAKVELPSYCGEEAVLAGKKAFGWEEPVVEQVHLDINGMPVKYDAPTQPGESPYKRKPLTWNTLPKDESLTAWLRSYATGGLQPLRVGKPEQVPAYAA